MNADLDLSQTGHHQYKWMAITSYALNPCDHLHVQWPQGDFHAQSVKIPVFPTPAGYMCDLSTFPSLKLRYIPQIFVNRWDSNQLYVWSFQFSFIKIEVNSTDFCKQMDSSRLHVWSFHFSFIKIEVNSTDFCKQMDSNQLHVWSFHFSFIKIEVYSTDFCKQMGLQPVICVIFPVFLH